MSQVRNRPREKETKEGMNEEGEIKVKRLAVVFYKTDLAAHRNAT